MPCFDGRDAADMYSQEAATLRNMLCGLCTRVDEAGKSPLIYADGVLQQWWNSHKRSDNARKVNEAATRRRDELADAAKKKLTPEELEALGIR